MPFYAFNLDSFQITDTRSVHTDTDYAVLTVSVGHDNPKTSTAMSACYGNLNNGTYLGKIGLTGLSILPDSPVTINYLILNAGFSTQGKVDTMLREVSLDMVRSANPAIRFMSCLQPVAEQYAIQLSTVLRPGCDGLVAAEQGVFSYQELASFTARSPWFTQATTHTGVIVHGCNPRPSNYIVHWSMREVVNIPDVTNQLEAKAASQLAGLVSKINTSGRGAYVVGQNPKAGFNPARQPITLTLGPAPR